MLFPLANPAFLARVTPAAGGAWVPTDVAGLETWYDFADVSTLTGDPSVTNVADKGSSEFDLVHLTSNPQRTTLNSRTAIDFNGSSQSLGNTTGAQLTNTPKTVAVVYNADVLSTTYIMSNTGGAGSDRFYMMGNAVRFGNAANLSISTTVSTTHAVVATVSAGSGSATVNVHVDGATTPATVSTDIGTYGANIAIGSFPNATGRFNGKIAEVIIYNTVLSLANRQKLEGYLAFKWGATLETGHPYIGIEP